MKIKYGPEDKQKSELVVGPDFYRYEPSQDRLDNLAKLAYGGEASIVERQARKIRHQEALLAGYKADFWVGLILGTAAGALFALCVWRWFI